MFDYPLTLVLGFSKIFYVFNLNQKVVAHYGVHKILLECYSFHCIQKLMWHITQLKMV